MSFFQSGYFQIVLSTVAVYLFIVIALRLFGKAEISQLSVTDLVFIMLLSNAVQNAMVGPDTTLVGGLVAAASLFVVNFIFKECIYHIPWFGRFVQGESLMLIYKGKVNRPNLKKAKLTEDELMEAVREHGVSMASEVDLAVLEVDGNISVLSGDFNRRTTKAVRKQRPLRKQTKKQQ